MNKPIDDYDLFDLDFEECIRRGREWLEWEEKNADNNHNPK